MTTSSRNMTSVFMTEQDKEIDTNDFLDNCEEEEFFLLRTEIEKHRKTQPIALCSVCFQPVVLRANTHRTTFFAHVKDSEDCPVKTTTNLTQEEIRAMQYNGQKEGRLHRENKEKISQLLIQDPLFENNVSIEKTFREKHPVGIAKQWRRPDISAKLASDKRDVVFELQISTTFLDVIIHREEFYKQNDAYITWIFLSFDQKKFTTLDIAYANKANIFVFNQEALYESEKRNSLILKCYYRKPYMTENLDIGYSWTSEFVDFSILNFDEENKKIFYIDTGKLKNDVIKQIQNERIRIKSEKLEAERIAREALRLQEQNVYDEQKRFEKYQQSYPNFKTPTQYKEKNHRHKQLSTKVVSHKSYGEAVICKKCFIIGKPKKLGRLFVCAKCGHECN
ncbi:DUF6035 family protein [Aliivibrio sp. S4TY2]|uniref:Competence protein CoiA n=2 Tax=Aliivibrio TaxID=511678 RepID=A0A4Q5KMA1_9GAMM|nr:MULTISPECIES: DUF6035 family protein [Aliivibrio]MDD9156309.1 DUF6035 family protein [Aliivibrio sp. S4TY2]MDD9160656.1 DUF6035 family protein [Aliivibrio sp. S4TY1]MDD9164016.1 DUF6035 family protein [Aliivibrio sp. S4MY2]MDD9168009.1 DUF6035 family protein [Aliivibrio sp. S4MY4]MDD9177152.1 DUF6035 family protein [Aliivibrio sp. A6]